MCIRTSYCYVYYTTQYPGLLPSLYLATLFEQQLLEGLGRYDSWFYSSTCTCVCVCCQCCVREIVEVGNN